MTRVLVVATSRKTRGGITSVVKAHETGEQWKKYHCRWIETHRDGPTWRKVWYLIIGLSQYTCLLPFYDIVHMHVSFSGSLTRKCLVMWFAKWMGKKTIVHFHPPTPDVLTMSGHTEKYRRLFGMADKVLVLSESWKTLIMNMLDIEVGNIEILYNPCPQVDEHKIIPIENRGNYILFAGTLIARKGYKCLLRAFARIARNYPEWKVVLAGVDEEHEAEGIVNNLGINEQVVLAGWCNKVKMQELYKNAGIYCLASSGEGFPMVVLEAWAYGVPVVCTPVGGLPDILHENINALTFEFDNDRQLSKQLKKLMDNVILRRKLSSEGLRLAKEVFNIEVINKQLGYIYAKI